MTQAPLKTVKVGVQTLDGLGHIAIISLLCDMKDHGRVHWPVYINVLGTRAKFSWTNGKNTIYREVSNGRTTDTTVQ